MVITVVCVLPWLQLVELGERGGFGYACKVGADMTSTPYVLIVQHDRIFRNR